MKYLFSQLYGMRVKTNDGAIGFVGDILFNDKTGDIIYFVVTTSTWSLVFGRNLLLSPNKCKVQNDVCSIDLSREQIRHFLDFYRAPRFYLLEKERDDALYTISSLGLQHLCTLVILPAPPKKGNYDQWEKWRFPRIRSLKETSVYHVFAKQTPRTFGRCVDAVVEDSKRRVDCFIVHPDLSESAPKSVAFNAIDSFNSSGASIVLKKRLSEIPKMVFPIEAGKSSSEDGEAEPSQPERNCAHKRI